MSESWRRPRLVAGRAIIRLLCVFAAFGMVVADCPAVAQTLTILYSFGGGTDGAQPQGSLVRDSSGNLYGTTSGGGANGYGTIFRIDAAGQYSLLYSFAGGSDGAYPQYSGLALDSSGNLYGTTNWGGNDNCNPPDGCGVVFEYTSQGQEVVKYRFSGGADGAYPYAGVIIDVTGNLYGTAAEGGNLTCNYGFGCGTVFKVGSLGVFSVLYTFSGPDGEFPDGVLAEDSSGNLYGTTSEGGIYGVGVAFSLTPAGSLKVLHRFGAAADGELPSGVVALGPTGSYLYGTTIGGGLDPSLCAPLGYAGCGTIFQIKATGRETGVYRFTGTGGILPMGGLIGDGAGNGYGTTNEGGDLSCNSGLGCGTVFKIDASPQETVLYSFTGQPDGSFPVAGVILDSSGNLYGTTQLGGTSGNGTVFKLAP